MIPTDMAFPVSPENAINNSHQYGLTKREWLIGTVAAGILANPEAWTVSMDKLAQYAIIQADAILCALQPPIPKPKYPSFESAGK